MHFRKISRAAKDNRSRGKSSCRSPNGSERSNAATQVFPFRRHQVIRVRDCQSKRFSWEFKGYSLSRKRISLYPNTPARPPNLNAYYACNNSIRDIIFHYFVRLTADAKKEWIIWLRKSRLPPLRANPAAKIYRRLHRRRHRGGWALRASRSTRFPPVAERLSAHRPLQGADHRLWHR